MLNVRKKHICSLKELFNVNLSSYFCMKYILTIFQNLIKFVQLSLKKGQGQIFLKKSHFGGKSLQIA